MPRNRSYRAEYDTPWVCSVCREPFDERDEFIDHWDEHHW